MSTKNNTLDKAVKGTYLTITTLPAGMFKIQLLRIGLSEGEKVSCLERLPGGTIIVQKNRQEIAIGYDLAKEIFVSLN